MRTEGLANSGNGYLRQRVRKHMATQISPPRLVGLLKG